MPIYESYLGRYRREKPNALALQYAIVLFFGHIYNDSLKSPKMVNVASPRVRRGKHVRRPCFDICACVARVVVFQIAPVESVDVGKTGDFEEALRSSHIDIQDGNVVHPKIMGVPMEESIWWSW